MGQAGAPLPAAFQRQLLPHGKPATSSSTGHLRRGQAGVPLAPADNALSSLSLGLEGRNILGAPGFLPAARADVSALSQRRRLPYGYSLCRVKAGGPEGQRVNGPTSRRPAPGAAGWVHKEAACPTASKTSPKAIRRNTERLARLVLGSNCALALHDEFHPVCVKYLERLTRSSSARDSRARAVAAGRVRER